MRAAPPPPGHRFAAHGAGDPPRRPDGLVLRPGRRSRPGERVRRTGRAGDVPDPSAPTAAVVTGLGQWRPKVLSTVCLYFIAVTLWLTAATAMAFATHRPAGIIAGTLFAAAGAKTILYAHRRR